MRRPRPPTIVRPLMWRAPLVALLLFAGCGHNIGDSCTTNVDCSPTGDRFCDTSAVNGYCTEENCGVSSCPSEAVCIRFFSPIDTEPCHFDTASSRSDCVHVDDRCVCDRTDGNGECSTFTAAGTNGHCAPSATERRWCERKCSSDGDCRAGYECRSTGTFGADPVPTFDLGAGQPTKFCAPTGRSS